MTGFKAAPFVEPATGLAYFRNRWYDPATGTFLTPDPEGYADSSNLYAAFANDPVNNTDPLGTLSYDPAAVGGWIRGGAGWVRGQYQSVPAVFRFGLEANPATRSLGFSFGVAENFAAEFFELGVKPGNTIEAQGGCHDFYSCGMISAAVAGDVGNAILYGTMIYGAAEKGILQPIRSLGDDIARGAAQGIDDGVRAAFAELEPRFAESATAVESVARLARYNDLQYIERVMLRASRRAINRSLATGARGSRAGFAAEEMVEKYAYQMQQRLMASGSQYRITTQAAADLATGQRVLARTISSFRGPRTAGAKILDYGFYFAEEGSANSARILSGADFTVSLQRNIAAGVPTEYARAFPGARLFGVNPRRIFGP